MSETQTPVEYKVDLEHFAGPLDLLLFLIRKEEVDIHDIPITRILDQYMKYLDAIRTVDLDEAGDFLVMAATLMVIKSKTLLPIEEVDLAEELDPRYELVQQLLEYKRLKQRAELLEQRAVTVSRQVGRPESARPDPVYEEDRSLDEVQVWDLLELFARVMRETGGGVARERVITGTEVPVREFAAKVEERVRMTPTRLGELLRSGATRVEIIGYFLAVLLLLKTQTVAASATGDGDIVLTFADAESTEEHEQMLELEDDFRA